MYDKSVDLDVSSEIISEMIAIRTDSMRNQIDPEMKQKLKNEIKLLSFERREMYRGNEAVIKKILNSYSAEIKKYRQR